jgi:hypothetical protein
MIISSTARGCPHPGTFGLQGARVGRVRGELPTYSIGRLTGVVLVWPG